ncbi:MAG: tetratricopeptide repeat protein, partial [Candidatus Hydrogenedentes bacterium]|nr:tetratricopeptide repeat protein [Candidatus Hydrogenedentota bacterium]
MAVEKNSPQPNKSGAPGKKHVKSLFDEKPQHDDLTQLLHDIQARPAFYGGIAVFLLACLLAGFLYKANSESGRKNVMTAYAQALDKEEPADQFAALEPLAQDAGKKYDEVVYITGETAYRAGQFDKAKTAFERMRAEFKDSPYTPDAVEGLGNIAENAKDYDGALTYYKEVRDSWATSFAARRQATNIAKMEERRGRLQEAVAAYREQMQLFPGSSLAEDASAALTRIEKSNPELFPKTETPTPSAPASPESPAPAGGEASTAPDLKMELTTPDVSATTGASQEQPGDLNIQLNTPDVDAGAPADPAPPAQQ